jgi:hypothetical protein
MMFSSNPQVNEAVFRLMYLGAETPYGQRPPLTVAQIRAYVKAEFGQAAARSLTLTIH